MGRARKRHVQQDLRFANTAGNLRGVRSERRRKRKQARTRPDGTVKRPVGRPPKGWRSSERHKVRPAIKASEPVHVTLRVADDIARKGLRKRGIYKAVREALLVTYRDESCRIVHQSIQDSHLHLLVEADNRTALARGMQAFQISAAKHINAVVSNAGDWWERRRMRTKPKRRKGSVFPDRYHEEIIRTPRQVRNALAYVLKNASHCTLSGRRVEFPTCWAQTRLLQRAQRAVGYRRPRFEDFIWDRSALPWPGQVDFQARHGPGVPEQLKS